MLFGQWIKWVIGSVVAIGLILGGYKLYNLGYDSAMAGVDRDNRIATDAAVEQARKEWQSTQTITQAGIQNVQNTKEKIIYITQQAERIVSPKCVDLGPDFSGVYNQYIGAIQGYANPSGNVSDAKVPSTPADDDANPN